MNRNAVPTRPLGRTGLPVPAVIFGTSALGNLYEEPSAETKRSILRNITGQLGNCAVLDSAGKYGAGLSLEWIGRGLRELGVAPGQVSISNKLGWYRVPLEGSEPTFEPGVWKNLRFDAEQRISAEGILQCWEQGCEILGAPWVPTLVSVHDPDEYLAGAASPAQREARLEDVKGAYASLMELRRLGKVKGVGIGSKDWKVIRELAADVDFDWVMIACSFTLFTHPPEMLSFLAELHGRGVGIVNSAVFNGGFLTGQSEFFDYKKVDASTERGRSLIAWRARFLETCRRFETDAAVACAAFGLSAPGVVSLALNSSKPSRVADNIAMVHAPVDSKLWSALKSEKLIDPAYPYLG